MPFRDHPSDLGLGQRGITDLALDEAEFRSRFEEKAPVEGVARQIPTRLVTHADSVLVGMAAIAAAPKNYALDYAGRGWV